MGDTVLTPTDLTLGSTWGRVAAVLRDRGLAAELHAEADYKGVSLKGLVVTNSFSFPWKLLQSSGEYLEVSGWTVEAIANQVHWLWLRQQAGGPT